MKPIATILLTFLFINLSAQKKTTLSFPIDSTKSKQAVLDSLLKQYSECDIFVITKVTEKKVYIKRLCKKRGKGTPIRKYGEIKEGNYLTEL
jgi:hypothetical protein